MDDELEFQDGVPEGGPEVTVGVPPEESAGSDQTMVDSLPVALDQADDKIAPGDAPLPDGQVVPPVIPALAPRPSLTNPAPPAAAAIPTVTSGREEGDSQMGRDGHVPGGGDIPVTDRTVSQAVGEFDRLEDRIDQSPADPTPLPDGDAEAPQRRPVNQDKAIARATNPRASSPQSGGQSDHAGSVRSESTERPSEIPGITERVETAHRQAATALEGMQAKDLDAGGDGGLDAINRLLSIIEDIHRTTSNRPAARGISSDIIARIERLETWAATNRNP